MFVRFMCRGHESSLLVAILFSLMLSSESHFAKITESVSDPSKDLQTIQIPSAEHALLRVSTVKRGE